MKLILASKSGVRKKILNNYDIDCEVIPSNVDEDEIKVSLQSEGADPLLISKNLAEIKSIKVSVRQITIQSHHNFELTKNSSSRRVKRNSSVVLAK